VSELERLLRTLPGLYEELEDGTRPLRTGDEVARGGRDPRDKPAPGRLEVMDHRHELVRGLRWWVDAVRERGTRTPRMGDNVFRMCAWLFNHLDVMADEDRDEMLANLGAWQRRAWRMMDLPDDRKDPLGFMLPPEAFDRVVQVKTAAEVLGCTVRTIQRRVPADRRPGGMVRLGDAAPRCELCDLIVGQCEHTRVRTVTVPVAH
jgi:hypothetical protein